MRIKPNMLPADHIVLVGTGEAATDALWRLCAAGARIRWYADRADLAEETVLAHALGRARIELSFDDPQAASLDGATAIVIASGRGGRLAERARARGVPVHFAVEDGLPAMAAPDPVHAVQARAATPAA